MKLRYTLEGLTELDHVLSTIKRESPHGAHRVQRRIQAMIELLLRHPQAGRLTRKRHLRCISASPYPYLIFYQTSEGEVIIHGVGHSARNPASMPGR